MSTYKLEPNPKLDAETLVLALNNLFLCPARTKMFAIAREITRRNITDDELMREMLEAMDLLEEEFLAEAIATGMDALLEISQMKFKTLLSE